MNQESNHRFMAIIHGAKKLKKYGFCNFIAAHA